MWSSLWRGSSAAEHSDTLCESSKHCSRYRSARRRPAALAVALQPQPCSPTSSPHPKPKPKVQRTLPWTLLRSCSTRSRAGDLSPPLSSSSSNPTRPAKPNPTRGRGSRRQKTTGQASLTAPFSRPRFPHMSEPILRPYHHRVHLLTGQEEESARLPGRRSIAAASRRAALSHGWAARAAPLAPSGGPPPSLSSE